MNTMKANTIIMTALVAVAAVPTFAAGPMLDKAVQAAASKVSATNVLAATANAAQEDPAAAPAVLKGVLGQRNSWTNQDVYNLYCAVLEGSGLRSTLSRDLVSYQAQKNQQEAGVQLLTALHDACGKLPKGTFETVMGMLLFNANGTANNAEFLATNPVATNTNATICKTPVRDKRPNPVPVTPEPISPQN